MNQLSEESQAQLIQHLGVQLPELRRFVYSLRLQADKVDNFITQTLAIPGVAEALNVPIPQSKNLPVPQRGEAEGVPDQVKKSSIEDLAYEILDDLKQVVWGVTDS